MSRQLAPAGSSTAASNELQTPTEQVEEAPITEAEVEGFREQDRYLPINNIQRIMKRSLPDSSKVAKDAKECIQECTSEFISFITSEAADRATNEKRKTITGDDILYALKTLGFEEYSEILLIYLVKYREQLQRSEPTRKRVRKSKKQTNGEGGTERGEGDNADGESAQNDTGDVDVEVEVDPSLDGDDSRSQV